ncbi:flavodoxin-dependent (E)-4-hydroxy-3-methylbut-2-enyl-diphosphate synthase [Desulfohalovibrio reitneri]|uniref:flavodoxin-dependent (E)-4-hydroxy-3-methylbut-2-enyl-diphosphate synthase n=1 Tax=Desulfohalovibrio reitneri TaxID=1307759 RepID=UPI0004A77069|nr:flavodoxin-dependent (E)-4-hydroxy-3-methylbut-2-enyl-diphosphate synthase [Desulfohalovibrio reitneri]
MASRAASQAPERRATRPVRLGPYVIGGGQPIRVQSMCTTDTRDTEATLAQVRDLAAAGCEIVRLAVPDDRAARALPAIVAESPVPLVADIHFDHRLALASAEAGMAGLRINPGNIGGADKVDAVVDAAKKRGLPIRIGVNSGSVEKDLLARFGGPTPEAMVESALSHVAMLERRGFDQIKISLKSSSVTDTIQAYRRMADRADYPLHIGVTEAGTLVRGAVKSSVGLGVLLAEGIGDTLRVSLTHEPTAEMVVAWEILRSLDIRARGPEIVSCPTCGRTEIDLIGLAEEVERRLKDVEEIFTVAVMGCVVNGPGEAREADIGVAGGRDKAVVFRKGEVTRTLRGDVVSGFMEELDRYLNELRGT